MREIVWIILYFKKTVANAYAPEDQKWISATLASPLKE
jgi:hypothetical protein